MARDLTDERAFFLSTLPAGPRDRWLAAATLGVSAAVFLAAAPFAKVPLAPLNAFIPAYQSAVVLNDLITAGLLFGQYSILQSRALLALATAYLFTAFIAIAHTLSFPGLFSPTGLLGAGPQSTAWLYMFWHAGFPLLVAVYAIFDRKSSSLPSARRPSVWLVIVWIVATLLVVVNLTLLATVGHELLPAIMQGSRYTPAMIGVVSTVWAMTLIALFFLWRRRPHTVLDLWLIVVIFVWGLDVALSAVLNAGRFDLGFYVGRTYGLLASGFVLLVLLIEANALYARLVEAHDKRMRRLDILRGIDRAIAAEESPDAIAAAVIQPLRELLDVPRAVINVFDFAAGEVEWLAAAGRRRIRTGPGVRYSLKLMGDIDALRRGESQVIDTHSLPPGPEVDALLKSGVHVYMAIPMIAGGNLIGALSFGGELRHFPAEQVDLAREVATQLAIAISQARLYTRIKQYSEELELRVYLRTSALEAANKELEAFSYSVSHDLRAPLRAVDGYARMLEEDYGNRLDAEGARILRAVRSNGQRMAQLIDDLLAFSRLGRAAVHTQPVEMNALVEQVVHELHQETDSRRIDFVIGPLGIAEVDPALFKQALTNLLSNAIKFTRDSDSPVIQIGCEEEGGASTSVVYFVKDNGAGFDMKYYEKLFGVFQRLHSSAEFPGTGVGLAIVQRVVNRHGGRVWAEGKPGEGATFFFTLRRGHDTARVPAVETIGGANA
jgi:signal transduction histidine kinase